MQTHLGSQQMLLLPSFPPLYAVPAMQAVV